MTYLTQLTNRIPAPVRSGWRTAGPFVALVLAGLALWLTNGEALLHDFNSSMAHLQAAPDANRQSGLYSFSYQAGFWLAQLAKWPVRIIAWLSFFWSLGAVVHWISFRWPTYFANDTVKQSPWLLLLITAVWLWVDGERTLTKWTGPSAINRDVANLMVVWCVAYTVWLYFRETRDARRQLTETATQAELTALKAQINPHFLFNSLNNIFGTALTEGGHRTPEGVQQLSGLLRYQLENTQVEQVDVAAELRFLDQYVQFHQQLLPNAVVHRYEWDEQPVPIAPLLLTPLVDYALQQPSVSGNVPVESRLTVKNRFLNYQLTYPALPDSAVDRLPLENLRQRLESLYAEQYSLQEKAGRATATLQLTIRL